MAPEDERLLGNRRLLQLYSSCLLARTLTSSTCDQPYVQNFIQFAHASLAIDG